MKNGDQNGHFNLKKLGTISLYPFFEQCNAVLFHISYNQLLFFIAKKALSFCCYYFYLIFRKLGESTARREALEKVDRWTSPTPPKYALIDFDDLELPVGIKILFLLFF